jgi:hypothetical protein
LPYSFTSASISPSHPKTPPIKPPSINNTK